MTEAVARVTVSTQRSLRLGTRGSPLALAQAGVIAAADGSAVIRGRVTGPAGEPLGRQLARILLRQGGAALLGRSQQGSRAANHQNHVMPAHQGEREAWSCQRGEGDD